MNIFIHQVHIKVKSLKFDTNTLKPNHVLDAQKDEIAIQNLKGIVLIKNATYFLIHDLLFAIIQQKDTKIKTLYLPIENKAELVRKIKKDFTIIKAAGGIVQKKEEVLMIYRLQRWDLPKGKLEGKEKFKETALREVQEETGILTSLKQKLTTTWHFYTQDGQNILKQTKWYLMDCQDDSQMQPQTTEDIEKIVWVQTKDIKKMLRKSYKSIAYVFERYLQQNINPS